MLSTPLKILLGILAFFLAISLVPWPEINPAYLDFIRQGFQGLVYANKYFEVFYLLGRATDLLWIEIGLFFIKLVMGIVTGSPESGFTHSTFYRKDTKNY